MKQLAFCIIMTISTTSFGQFTGHSGVYFLGAAQVALDSSVYANPSINGAVVRFRWSDTETSPGIYDWSFVDTEIAKAMAHNKKVSLQPLGDPEWLANLGAETYYSVNKNPNSPWFGQIQTDFIPWDSVFIERYKQFIQNMAQKYASDTTVTYINTVGGYFSRNLPDTVIVDTIAMTKQAFWVTFNYDADTLASIMNAMTDHYMSIFPSTPLWCSVDYVKFQMNASGQAVNYLASLYCNYGIMHYPDRFGLFREDLSGCNPSFINPTSHWYIMQQNPCRTGAQMLWHVQDGPMRMNQCGMLPNTKPLVLDSAVNKGLALGMRYIEIYGADINDTTLNTTIQQANNKLIAKGNVCNNLTIIKTVEPVNKISIYPNPVSDFIHIQGIETDFHIKILTSTGQLVVESNENDVSVKHLPPGFYLLYIYAGQTASVLKFIRL